MSEAPDQRWVLQHLVAGLGEEWERRATAVAVDLGGDALEDFRRQRVRREWEGI